MPNSGPSSKVQAEFDFGSGLIFALCLFLMLLVQIFLVIVTPRQQSIRAVRAVRRGVTRLYRHSTSSLRSSRFAQTLRGLSADS